MPSALKNLANGVATARHTLAIAIIVVTGVVSATLIYAQVRANEDKTVSNEQKIEAIRSNLNSIKTQQRVIINDARRAEENDKEFRDRTDRQLDRILDRLTPRRGSQ